MGLTVDQVAEARRLVGGGAVTTAGLAREWGLAMPTLRAAVLGRTHRSVPVPPVAAVGAGGRSRTALTAEVVEDARRRARGGASVAELAREAGVAYNTMHTAVVGRTWLGVGEPPVATDPPPGQGGSGAKLTARRVAEARRAVCEGRASLARLAARYGVAEVTVWSAVHGVTWRSVVEPPVPRRERGGIDPVPLDLDVLRARLAAGEPLGRLAAEAGVHRTTLWRRLQAQQP